MTSPVAARVAAVMLDTHIISDLMRNPSGPAQQHLRQALVANSELKVYASVVVDCEIRFGLRRKASKLLQQAYEQLLQAMEVLPLDHEASHHYADIRAHLERKGTPIGPNDLLIAAHARALGCALITVNEAEFRRVPGLRVENWL